jgi:hypothetical protein
MNVIEIFESTGLSKDSTDHQLAEKVRIVTQPTRTPCNSDKLNFGKRKQTAGRD